MATAREMPKHHSTHQMVKISDLTIDPEAQRKMSMAWVKARVPKFDVDQLGWICINVRANGKAHVVDGQHRVELMRQVGWGDQLIHAEVFRGLTQAEEAELFIARNDRKAVRKYDKFRIAITAKNERACAIDTIVRAHGLVISDQARDGHIVAVDALEKIFDGGGIASSNEGPAALGKALRALVRAWGNQASSVNGRVIQGLGMVFLRYNGEVNEVDLVKKLAPFPGGAAGLLGKGRALQETRGKALHHSIANIIVDVYNRGRRGTKLESWE